MGRWTGFTYGKNGTHTLWQTLRPHRPWFWLSKNPTGGFPETHLAISHDEHDLTSSCILILMGKSRARPPPVSSKVATYNGLKFVQHFGKQTVQNCFLDPGTSGSRDQCLDGDGLCILHIQQSVPSAKRVETIRKDELIMCGPYSSEVSWCVTEAFPPSSLFIIFYHFGCHVLR